MRSSSGGAVDVPELPAVLLRGSDSGLEPGTWHPIFQLLTAGTAGAAPTVCLLSAVELRATPAAVLVAARSRRAAANLAVNPLATLVAWDGQLHYVALELRDRIERENVFGYAFAVGDVRIDDIGVATRPLQYQMQEHLATTERWSLTLAVLRELLQRRAAA